MTMRLCSALLHSLGVLVVASLAACSSNDPIVTVEEDLGKGLGDCPATPPECAIPASGIHNTFASAAQVERELAGVWLRCPSTEAYPPAPQIHGFELRASHHYSVVLNDGAGHCSRGKGFGMEGTWEVVDISEQNPNGTYQLVLWIAGGGSSSMVPSIAQEPRLMHDGGGIWGTFAYLE
jgi:hypothetical protein